MSAFVRVTAAIFIVIGLLLILVGSTISISGFVKTVGSPRVPTGALDLRGLTLFSTSIIGGVLFFQGLLVAAIGEVLWVLVDISKNTHETSQILRSLRPKT